MFIRTLVFLLTASFTYIAQAQTESDTLSPVKKDKQFVFGLNTNSVGFTYKKYCTNTFALRIGLTGGASEVNSGKVTESSYTLSNQMQVSTAGDDVDTYSNSSQNNFGVVLGFQKSFLVQKRFEPYWGIDLAIARNAYSRENSSVSYYYNSSNSYNRVVNANKSKTSNAISVGINTLIGFNYYIAPRFALGAEFWITPMSVYYGGTTHTETSFLNTDNTMSSILSSSSSSTTKGGINTRTSFDGSVRITATLMLNKRK